MTIRSFARDKKASIIIPFALFLPLIIGGGAFALDIAYYHHLKNRLQSAADAAALAAVRDLGAGSSQVYATATDFAAQNVPTGFGTVVKTSDVSIGTYDASTKTFAVGIANSNAVRVTAAKDSAHGNAPKRFLSGIYDNSALSISATAIAVINPPTACVIALSPNAAGAIQTSGNGKITVPNCGIHANSTDAGSLKTGNNSTMLAKVIRTAGGYSGLGFTPLPQTSQPTIVDPLLKIPEPAIPATCTTTNATFSSDATFPANSRFCGETKITGGAMITFAPGIHFFTGGTLTLLSSSNVTANGAMFFFAKDATLDSSSTGVFKLSAPQSGTYKGISMFQSRDTPSVVPMKLTGSKDFYMDGSVYLTKADVTFIGSSDLNITTQAGYVIANTFRFSGNSTLKVDSYGGAVVSGLTNKGILAY